MEEPIVERENKRVLPRVTVNDAVDWFFDIIATFLGNLASNVVPLAAGVLPAYLTWDHILHVLNFPPWVAFSGAFVVEFMGLGAGMEIMTVMEHNRKHKDPAAKLPKWAPFLAAGWYIGIMIVFNVILEINMSGHPTLETAVKILSSALFATLAIPGYMLVAAKTIRKETLATLEKERQERKETRRENKKNKQQQQVPAKRNIREDLRNAIYAGGYLPSNAPSAKEFADALGLSDTKDRNAVRTYLNQFKQDEIAGRWR